MLCLNDKSEGFKFMDNRWAQKACPPYRLSRWLNAVGENINLGNGCGCASVIAAAAQFRVISIRKKVK